MVRITGLLLIQILFFSTGVSYCSEWDKYLEIKNTYFYIDKQRFEEINCEINVPLMNNLLDQIKTQIGQFENKIILSENLKILQTNDVVSASYKRSGFETTEKMFGEIIEGKQNGGGITTEYTATFDNTSKNKLILKSMSATITNPMGRIKSDILISYQQIGVITFPKKITSSFEQEMQSIQQKGQFDINIINCRSE